MTTEGIVQEFARDIAEFAAASEFFVLVQVDEELTILTCNDAFVSGLHLPAPPVGRKLGEFCLDPSRAKLEAAVKAGASGEAGSGFGGRTFILHLTGGAHSILRMEAAVDRFRNGLLLLGRIQPLSEAGALEDLSLLNNELVNLTRELKQRNEELIRARKEVKTLQGMLPICARCKNIRNDQGFWESVESYVRDRTDASFSHGLCPSCVRKLYPDLNMDETA